MGEADFPEPGIQAVRHEAERGEVLLVRDFVDVLAELFLAFARVAGGPLGFDHAEHAPGRVVEAEIGDAVPRRRVIALHRHLETNLRPVAELPARREQLRVDEQGPGLGFAQFHLRFTPELSLLGFHLNTSDPGLISFPVLVLQGSGTKCTENPISRRVRVSRGRQSGAWAKPPQSAYMRPQSVLEAKSGRIGRSGRMGMTRWCGYPKATPRLPSGYQRACSGLPQGYPRLPYGYPKASHGGGEWARMEAGG